VETSASRRAGLFKKTRAVVLAAALLVAMNAGAAAAQGGFVGNLSGIDEVGIRFAYSFDAAARFCGPSQDEMRAAVTAALASADKPMAVAKEFSPEPARPTLWINSFVVRGADGSCGATFWLELENLSTTALPYDDEPVRFDVWLSGVESLAASPPDAIRSFVLDTLGRFATNLARAWARQNR
jgi:hypothetical protein